MASFSLLYALLLPLSTCPDKISQQSHSYTRVRHPFDILAQAHYYGIVIMR